MDDKHAPIRAALDAGPTPGPWFHGAKNGEHKYCVYDKICWTDEHGRHSETPNMVVHVSPDDGKYRDAAYIAACHPEAIRALLAEVDALRDAAQETVRVIESNPSSISDTVWVTGNMPETLLNRCRAALAQEQGGSDAE